MKSELKKMNDFVVLNKDDLRSLLDEVGFEDFSIEDILAEIANLLHRFSSIVMVK